MTENQRNELATLAELSGKKQSELIRDAIDRLMEQAGKSHIDASIGNAGGLYRRDYGKSHGVGLADAILAATSESENAELKTLNTKHYPMFKNLSPAYKK